MALVVFAGGVTGPLLLMLGLTTTPASSAALLLNLEGLATMGIAWAVFMPWPGISWSSGKIDDKPSEIANRLLDWGVRSRSDVSAPRTMSASCWSTRSSPRSYLSRNASKLHFSPTWLSSAPRMS